MDLEALQAGTKRKRGRPLKLCPPNHGSILPPPSQPCCFIEQQESRIRLLQKAQQLAFPEDLTGTYKNTASRKQRGYDHPLGGTAGLAPFHKRRLKLLLEECLFKHRWHEAAGILSVLLKGLSLERTWHPENFRFYWAAMETIRQIEGLQGNGMRIKRMYHILYDKQPKSINIKEKTQAGAVRLELALYLLDQKQYEDAQLASRPLMDVPPYRDHAVANMIHGLILHSIWYESIIQDLKYLSEHRLDHNLQCAKIKLAEGVGENEDVSRNSFDFETLPGKKSSKGRLKDDLAVESPVQRDQSFADDEDQLNFVHRNNQKTNFHDHKCPSQGFYNNMDEEQEKSYLQTAVVQSIAGMDRRLFPVYLPRMYRGQVYTVPMGSARIIGYHTNAVKHFKQALAEAPHLIFVLLPLVQLLLAVADVEGAYKEIEKCCQASDHIMPFRIKCLLLESLEPRNPEMLAHSYEETLDRDPSSEQAINSLIAMHDTDEYDTFSLIDYVACHLDGSRGSNAIWKKLAQFFLLLKYANMNIGVDGDVQGWYNEVANETLQYFLDHNTSGTWNDRCTWWRVKHFNVANIALEQKQDGGYMRLAYKAACAAHFFGANSSYLSEVKQQLDAWKKRKLVALLEEHTRRAFELEVFLGKGR